MGRKGVRPREIHDGKTRTGRRAGEACSVRWSGYVKSLNATRMRSSQRSCITSPSIGSEPRTRGSTPRPHPFPPHRPPLLAELCSGGSQVLRVRGPVHAWKLHAREPGDLLVTRWIWPSESRGQGQGRNPMMHDDEKSDGPVVPANHRNKALQGAADGGEARGPAKGNPRLASPAPGPARSKTLCMRGSSMRENREVSLSLAGYGPASCVGKAKAVTP